MSTLDANQCIQGSYADSHGALQVLLIDALVGVKWDTVTATYPINTQEVYTYTLSGVTVRTVTVNYTDSTKTNLSTVVKS